MPDQEPGERSWPPPPTGQKQPPLTAPVGLPRGLKIGLAAAALGVLFTLWQIVRLNPNRYPLLHFLPNMPTHMLFTSLFGGYWVVILSLPMLAVLVLAGVGLAVGVRDWRVRRRAGRHGDFGLIGFSLALNLLPFVLFANFFIQRGWISIAVE